MIRIPITQGKFALIDDEDFLKVSKFKNWYHVVPKFTKTLSYAAAKTSKQRKTVLMHRLIMNPKKGTCIDHIDGNGLNNQKCNLRECTREQNQFNCKIHSTNKTGYSGVSWNPRNKNYRAYINHKNKHVHIGCFKTKEEARIARARVAIKLRGEFARI